MPEHVDLTDPELHEPKGAAAAASGEVYIADGAGSGTWTSLADYFDLGWEVSQHDGAVQTFTTTPSVLQINGSGTSSNDTYLPPSIAGSDTLWDTVANKITPIAEGDCYDVRLDLPVTAISGTPTHMILELDISGSGSPTNVIVTRNVSIYKTPPFDVSLTFPVFCLATFVANGGQIFCSVDASTSIGIDDPQIFIERTFKAL